MMLINGRIVDFLSARDKDGYASFIFQSDYDKEHPRFEAICSGKIPDVVPGVPIKVEFSDTEIKKINVRKIEKLTYEVWNQHKNEISYAAINYHDEEYAKSLLVKIKGISDKTATKILDAVDGNLGRLSDLWDDDKFWKGIRGAKRWITDLKNEIGTMMSKEGMIKRYQRYGIGYPQVDALTAIYGFEAEDKLKKNPYAVLHRIELSFQVADNLAKDLGFDYLTLERIKSMIYQVLDDNETSGNTTMEIADFYAACAWLHKVSAWKKLVVSPYCILAVISIMDNVYYEDGTIGYIRTLEKEVDIAFQLNRLMTENTDMHTENAYFDKIQNNYNKEQLEFLKQFDKNSVMILLGRGGTGKTHTICGAIQLFKKNHPDEEVRLCAPTARAAGVLKEHSGHESSTIHIMLELNPYNTEEAGRNEENPLNAKLIIVDEMSMVDTELMFHLLKAIKTGAKVILSGDPDQLESVGCGAVLRDLIASDMIPKVELLKIMRQSEGSPVIENCSRVLAGSDKLIEADTFHIRNCKTEEEAKAYLKSCYCGNPHDIQIISTTKKGILGTESINKEFENTNQKGIWLHGDFFRIGDKVIFTRNNYDIGYCNGDIGFIESDVLPVSVRKQGCDEIIEIAAENISDMEHADAITIHKSQGSEYKKVYILLPDSPPSLLTRNMVNTAISRTKNEVILITVNHALSIAVSNRYKKYRKTKLQEKVKNIGGNYEKKDKSN